MTGKHIQDLMKQEGYSVTRMAELIGTSQPNLTSALKHDDIRTGLLEGIAKAMGKPLAFFYGETYSMSIIEHKKDVTTLCQMMIDFFPCL